MRAREDRLFDRYCRNGDTRALAEVFDRTAPEVWRIASYLTRRPEIAEDAVQATFLAVIEGAATWDPRQRFVPWLLGILANQVRTLRRQQAVRIDAARLPPRATTDPTALAEEGECVEVVRAALPHVPEVMRAVLERYLLHGDAPAEIAARLGLRPGTARMRLQRGLSHLRRLLPAGLASGCVMAREVPAATLASLRLVVLAQAATRTPVVLGGTALGNVTVTGTIMMKKVSVGVLLLGLAATAWLVRAPATPGLPAGASRIEATSASGAQKDTRSKTEVDALAAPARSGRARIGDADESPFVVRGRALGAADAPYPGARLRAELYSGYTADGAPLITAELLCDAAGAFAWKVPAPANAVALRIAGLMPRHVGEPETVVVPPGDPPPEDIEVQVLPLDRVAMGRVTDEHGHPIAGAGVSTALERLACAPDGSFRVEFSSVHGGVRAHAPQYLSDRRRFLEATERDVRVDFRLRKGLRVAGQVIDGAGVPVAGANVHSFHMLSAAAVTGADGHFELTDLDPDREGHTVFARAAGYVEARADVRSLAAPSDLRLVLRRGARVEGRVLGPTFAPAAGAALYLGPSLRAYNRLDAIAKDGGAFVFEAVAAGKHTLVTTRRGLATDLREIVVPDGVDVFTTEVQLEPEHFIAGRVCDEAGQAIAGALVAAKVIPPASAGRGRPQYLALQARTSGAGGFRLGGLPAGRVTLEFVTPSHVRTEVADVQVDRDDVQVQLQRAATIGGRVLDAETGQPVPAFKIRFVPPVLRDGERRGGSYAATWVREGVSFTSPEGRWRADREQMEPGTIWGVEARADGYAPARDTHVVATVTPGEACVLRLQRGCTVSGRVVASGGEGIADATVTWFADEEELRNAGSEPYGLLRTNTDAAGNFRLTDLPPGDAKLAVVARDRPRHVEGPFRLHGGQRHEREILIAGGASIRGVVAGSDGEPVVGAQLFLRAHADRASARREATTGAAGSFVFAELPAGDYELSGHARREGVTTCYARILALGTAQDLRVRLTPAGSASVRARMQTDPPVPESTSVMLLPSGPPDPARLTFRATAGSERFELRGLTAGEYRLLVTTGDRRVGSAHVTLIESATVDVTVTLANQSLLGR